MADPRSRHAGRKSPTFNPARASMPVNIGYNLPYTGELHAVPAARYEASVPRRHDPKTTATAAPPATTVTTYNVTKDMSRSLSRSNRNRSSTVDSHAGKPIIVTTNHPRPHVSSSHASGSVRATSPSRDREPYRPSESAYYAVQPASSIRSRSHNRHSYTQGAPLGDEFYRLRERVGGVGLTPEGGFWGPSRTSTDNFRNPRPHVLYTTAAHPAHAATPAHHATSTYGNNSAVADYDDDYYEYTKPSELVRYDLDHDQERRSRRDSNDRPYYRPHVNVVSHDTTTRYEPRARPKPPPPTSAGLDRYNRAAAAGTYDRPSVTMPAPPAVPPPPPIDTSRRPALLEAPRSPTSETRNPRPRPVSLYQDGPARPSHADDMYRSRDDERVGKDRRERDDGYRDDNVVTRGFGIRTDTLDPSPARQASALSPHDDRRPRHETVDRASRHGSDESLTHARHHDRDAVNDHRSRAEESRDRNDGLGRKESVSRTRDKVAAGLKAAAVGLLPIISRDDTNVSPRRRASDEDKEYSSRGNETSKPREKEPTDSVERREPRKGRTASVSGSKDRDSDANRDREIERERQRGRDHDLVKERERERDRDDDRDQRERQWHDAEAKLNGSSKKETSPDDASNIGRRRQRPSSGFDPTDTKGLMDLKAELAALDDQHKGAGKVDESDALSTKEAPSAKAAPGTNGSDKGHESADESRGREIVPAREEKQVRVVSPPREKAEHKPIKGILKTPSVKFPEDSNPIREGVAPHKDDQSKKDVPAGARWTKISRKKVNPEALTIGKERFEVRDDFVIVLRVLNKEEIQAYATATAQIREMRRKEFEKDSKHERHSDEEQTRSDEERQRRHRHRQEKEDDEYRRGRATDDKHRRHKYDDDSETRPKTIEYNSGHNHRHYDSNAEDRR
ncbi:hypothetical protein FHL15_010603 [Xylaria flabelliformis]|uniref:DUF8035 domain-containing protein n=1 Tax=Xylaria flabelliformis TaxID=2512241 RepID=A0A553HKL2_9PEZI|nr:hypothetical protein FHL15_010603 [Xylaria flabelliformis]